MGTIATIEVVEGRSAGDIDETDAAIDRAFEWFRQVETICTRFDPSSELMTMCQRVGTAMPVSDILFAATEMAIVIAASSERPMVKWVSLSAAP